MLLNADYFTPDETTGYVREAVLDYPVNRFALAQWLPNRNIDDLVYRFTRGGDGLIDAASFRSYDSESSIGKRPPLTRVSGDLPPISRKIPLGEYDRLRSRANPEEPIRKAILGDADKTARQVNARIELARGDALVNGSVTFAELGGAVANYGRDSSMAYTVPTLWSSTGSADPLSDLQSAITTYINLNGVPPAAMVTSQYVRNNLLRNAAIRALAAVAGITPTLVSQSRVNEILDSFALPPLTIYDAQVKLNGTATRIIPNNVVLLLPPAVDPTDYEGTELGATFWGTTAESLDPRYGLTDGAEAGIVTGVYSDEDPITLWTKSAAIAVPVLANPNLAMCLTVQ